MANNITNRLNIIGEKERIREILSAIQSDKHGLGSIDFEKIIPMPTEIFRGNLGQQEQETYGENNWFDWSVKNWGTKWNSYGYDCFPTYAGGTQIQFHTAWTRPESVIRRLSEMFPDVQILHAWADEDIGAHVGEVLYQDGEEIEVHIPDERTTEAYEMASEIMDVPLSEYGLYYNEKTKNYGYEEYEKAASIGNIHVSPDFQCDLTEGYPTVLVWNKERNTAILQPAPAFDDGSLGAECCRLSCSKWDVHPCTSWQDYNDLLQSIGDEAFENAAVPLDDEDEAQGMGGLE